MSETMGQIIRRLRKERNLTQEELAEQLNVTYQAVSRWENGTGMPDISQIVPLSNVFGVTTDVLFGIENTNITEEAYKIINEANNIRQYGKPETYLEQYNHILEGLKRFPNNLILLNNCIGLGLMLCLPENSYLYSSDRAEKIAAETERQANLIISYSKNTSDILRAHQILLFLYSTQGNYEKASAEAANFPVRADFTFCSNMARIDKEKGDWENVIKHLSTDNVYIFQAFEDNTARLGKAYYSIGKYNEAITVYENWFKIMNSIFGDNFPPFHDFDSGDIYILLAQAYIAVGNQEKALESAERSIMYYLNVLNSKNNIRNGLHIEDSPIVQSDIIDVSFSVTYIKERLTEKLKSSELTMLLELDRFKELCKKVNEL